MRLDELEIYDPDNPLRGGWIYHVPIEREHDHVVVWKRHDEDLYIIERRKVRDQFGNQIPLVLEKWYDISALDAQAILYHLFPPDQEQT